MLPSFSDGQPESIAQDIENMVHLYVDKVLTLLQFGAHAIHKLCLLMFTWGVTHSYPLLQPNCIILAISPANQDIATSDAIKLARDVDPTGMNQSDALILLRLLILLNDDTTLQGDVE